MKWIQESRKRPRAGQEVRYFTYAILPIVITAIVSIIKHGLFRLKEAEVKRRLLLSLVAWGVVLTGLVVGPPHIAYAQCGGPNDPPCEPGGAEKEKKSKPTPVPPQNTPTACSESTWYRDADVDGYGNPYGPQPACSAPAGYTALVPDCNDTNAAMHPGATDICGDGIDQDCDGTDATCAVAAAAPVTEACVGPDCESSSPGAGGAPWIFGAGGLLLGILIGTLLPFKAGSFFDSSVGKGTPGGGDTDPAGSFFDSPRGGTDGSVSAGTPGYLGNSSHTPGSLDGSVNPGGPASEAGHIPFGGAVAHEIHRIPGPGSSAAHTHGGLHDPNDPSGFDTDM